MHFMIDVWSSMYVHHNNNSQENKFDINPNSSSAVGFF